MKFLTDENVPRPLARLIAEHGYDTSSVTPGASDKAVFEQSTAEQRILITNDTDFLDTFRFTLARTPGRIVLRVFPTIFALQQERLMALLDLLPNIPIAEHLVVLSAEDVVVRDN